MNTEQSSGCIYFNSGAYDGTMVIQCASFNTMWNLGDTIHVFVNSNLGGGEGTFIINNADFTATPLEGEIPLTVHFTSESSDDVTEWYWDFEHDGIIDSNEQNPTWTYNIERFYRVYLCVLNDNGYGDAEIKYDYIPVNPVDANNDELQIANYQLQNHPNPFNPETTISYELPENVRSAKIEIYNLKGQKVKRLDAKSDKLGMNSIIWNSKDDNGKAVSSGVYFYRLNINGKTEAVKKCLLMK